jgi:hypothetical protein
MTTCWTRHRLCLRPRLAGVSGAEIAAVRHPGPGESLIDVAFRSMSHFVSRRTALVDGFDGCGPVVPFTFPPTVLTMPWWITE